MKSDNLQTLSIAGKEELSEYRSRSLDARRGSRSEKRVEAMKSFRLTFHTFGDTLELPLRAFIGRGFVTEGASLRIRSGLCQ